MATSWNLTTYTPRNDSQSTHWFIVFTGSDGTIRMLPGAVTVVNLLLQSNGSYGFEFRCWDLKIFLPVTAINTVLSIHPSGTNAASDFNLLQELF